MINKSFDLIFSIRANAVKPWCVSVRAGMASKANQIYSSVMNSFSFLSRLSEVDYILPEWWCTCHYWRI